MARGRKTLFRKEIVKEAERMASEGFNLAQIARVYGVRPCTLTEWGKKNLELAEALKRGQEIADNKVEIALFKRACGFKYNEVTIKRHPFAERKKVRQVVVKYVAPDVGAIVFYLCNRKKDFWKQQMKFEHGVAEASMDFFNQAIKEAAGLKKPPRFDLGTLAGIPKSSGGNGGNGGNGGHDAGPG